ncbi:MAG: tRNA threonylcarbamoyladenosine dehydratase [Spirochaetaceae bacterium]|nr:tRNA threonylcarbamoyladenosine dehydratase [Spirochaetaceae bacterium]
MKEQFSRTAQLLGNENVEKLFDKHVIVFGVGGVGGYVVEALARSGIGKISIVDNDVVNESNINRQIIALHSTVGMQKVEVLKNHILDINPECQVFVYNHFFLPENSNDFDFSIYDYVVDAVDTVTAKIEIIKKSKESNVPVISSMGTGNKLNPMGFKVSDISKTKVCPLARVMRNELKKRGISKVKCVYSEENPVIQTQTPASVAFVPSVAGLLIASEVVKDLCIEKNL